MPLHMHSMTWPICNRLVLTIRLKSLTRFYVHFATCMALWWILTSVIQQNSVQPMLKAKKFTVHAPCHVTKSWGQKNHIFRMCSPNCLFIGTQEIRFGGKTGEIAKFNILDEKWPTDRRDRRKKLSNSFTFIGITIMLLQLGWKNGCLELLGCEWINFCSQTSEYIELLGPHHHVNHSGHTSI